MSDQHSIYPPSIFVWDLSRPNIGKLIIHTMEAANDLYTRGDVYDYGPAETYWLPIIDVERLGWKARTKSGVMVPVYLEPDIAKPYIRDGGHLRIGGRTMDVFAIFMDWLKVYPPVALKNEKPMWV